MYHYYSLNDLDSMDFMIKYYQINNLDRKLDILGQSQGVY